MSVNLDGVVLCYKYAAAQMIKQGDGGRLIGMYSFHGGPIDPQESYTSSSCVFNMRKERFAWIFFLANICHGDLQALLNLPLIARPNSLSEV